MHHECNNNYLKYSKGNTAIKYEFFNFWQFVKEK